MKTSDKCCGNCAWRKQEESARTIKCWNWHADEFTDIVSVTHTCKFWREQEEVGKKMEDSKNDE